MMQSNICSGDSSAHASPCPVDIISRLPDSVLSHILSFLPTTEEAVKTTILSKRWRYVWTYVHKLVFQTRSHRALVSRKHFDQFVYKVLKLHQGSIKEFTLSGYTFTYNLFHAVSWINTVIVRGVERLHVDVDFQDGTHELPHSIFSCKTLVDFKIWSSLKSSIDIIPSTPIFPCLKKLQVMYYDDDFFKCIVSRCSVLEHFIVDSLRTSTHIVSSSMKRLELCSDSTCNLKVVVSVPSLQYLKFNCALPFEFIVEEQLSSLIEAEIYFREIPWKQKVNIEQLHDSFVRLIQPISNVKLLRIESSFTKFFNPVWNGRFTNLTKLEILSSFFEWRLLLNFMENSINLEAISLKKVSTLNKYEMAYIGTQTSTIKKHNLAWKEPKEVPTSLSSPLRIITINGYGEEVLPIVKYVLRTAQILEQVKVNIHCANCHINNSDWKFDMLQNLQKVTWRM